MRKFASMAIPWPLRMDSGWNCAPSTHSVVYDTRAAKCGSNNGADIDDGESETEVVRKRQGTNNGKEKDRERHTEIDSGIATEIGRCYKEQTGMRQRVRVTKESTYPSARVVFEEVCEHCHSVAAEDGLGVELHPLHTQLLVSDPLHNVLVVGPCGDLKTLREGVGVSRK